MATLTERFKLAVYASADFPSTLAHARELRDYIRTFVDQEKDNQLVQLWFVNGHKGMRTHIYDIRQILGYSACAPIYHGGADAHRSTLADRCTHAIIFWDGKSTGTKKMIDLWEKTGKPFALVMVDP